MTLIEILGIGSTPAVLAWCIAAVLPKHSVFAYKAIGFALIWSMVVFIVASVYGVWWLSQHICY